MAVDTSRQARQAPPKFINSLIVLLLRSPLHGMVSKSLMLLTFTGRKSGKQFTIPIGYTRQRDTVNVFTDHGWWKNLLSNTAVTLTIKGKKFQGTAEVEHDNTELIAAEMLAFLKLHKGAARAYGVKIDANGEPELATVQEASHRFTLIRIHLK
ncbi:MAG: nitroreductase/quinone reductase family protein [Ktedonobacteraceae bacterium]